MNGYTRSWFKRLLQLGNTQWGFDNLNVTEWINFVIEGKLKRRIPVSGRNKLDDSLRQKCGVRGNIITGSRELFREVTRIRDLLTVTRSWLESFWFSRRARSYSSAGLALTQSGALLQSVVCISSSWLSKLLAGKLVSSNARLDGSAIQTSYARMLIDPTNSSRSRKR